MSANTSITLKDGTLGIAGSAFSGCYSLTSITIPSGVTSIGSSAFYLCSGLDSITIPNSVTSIGSSAFYHCSGLGSITIPNSVTSIGEEAFYYSGLGSITIGNSVTSIGDGAFLACFSLTTVNYLGSSADWDKINIGSSNTTLLNANIVYDYKLFTNTVDGGYYTESDSNPMSEITGGILAFSSKYNQFEENKANITKYGFLVYNQANESKKATVEASSVENLTATNGKFSTYLQVPKANLTTRVVAKPFVIVSGTTIWGDIMETSVAELDKWLGKKAN